MARNSENDYPQSPTNGESEDEELRSTIKEEEPNDSVARILKQLQNTGALIKKPKQEYRCNTCDKDYRNWEELESHLIQHVSLPSIILEKLSSDDELDHSGDENWSDEDDLPQIKTPPKTPQKIDVSQLLKNKGIQIKPATPSKGADALNKLSGLGFTIKKNVIKEEVEEKPSNQDLMQKLGNLGGIKLKLKSDGNNSNTFKVVNGLKDFKTSDDEDGSGNEEANDFDEEHEKNLEGSGQESADEQNKESDDSMEKSPLTKNTSLNIKPNPKLITPKVEPAPESAPEASASTIRRPVVKQTPKRGPNNYPLGIQIKQVAPPKKAPSPAKEIPTQTLAKSPVHNNNAEPVVVKKEVDDGTPQSTNATPLFTDQIKTERSSPPIETVSTPLISRVKSETEPLVSDNAQPLFSNQSIPQTTPSSQPLLPVTKTEDSSMTIIEINGDSNDEDDDCCVVSATPAPDVKPIIPKTENTTSYAPPTSYPSLQSATPSRPITMTEKQHSFNWNAPDTKPAIDILERSADDIFESLLSSTKKEGGSLSDTSEYISLDRLGSQHTCDICNTRFTDVSLLDEHIRTTGHSKSVILPSSSAMMSYSHHQASNPLLASLLPVKQLAEQVGKLSTIGSGSSPYTHQQNVMINIQAYPGGPMAPPSYNSYAPAQNMPPNYSQAQNNMYGSGQPMPNQYQGSPYMGQQGYGQQYQPPMSKPGQMPQNAYASPVVSSPYYTASPLESMQQAVYGQPQMNPPQPTQMTQMGPPAAPSPGHSYAQSISPAGSMKPPMNPPMNQSSSGIRIQNVQTFSPGQLVGSNGQPVQPGQVTSASPGQVRMAGPSLAGGRPRMPGAVRGMRPSIRPGIQVQGQVRGGRPAGPRMVMKRPAGAAAGPAQKRRTDMLLPGKHDNEDCQVMAMQRQREGLPMIQSVQGAKDKLNLGSQISITKKTVNKEANAMANALASRGISVKKKQKSRSPSPERPVPHIPNLPAGMSIKHTSKPSRFSIPEVGAGGMYSCRVCKKSFMNSSSLASHMSNAHPQSKMPIFKCDECSAAYPKSLQLQHHKRIFHNVTGPNRELGLPVVDFSLPENLERLSGLGIYSYIPLANREEASGCFGIPVISVHNMQNGVTNNLQALGADGLLSLGPLKPLPNS